MNKGYLSSSPEKQYSLKITVLCILIFLTIFIIFSICYTPGITNLGTFVKSTILTLTLFAFQYYIVCPLMMKNSSVRFFLFMMVVNIISMTYIYLLAFTTGLIKYPDYMQAQLLLLNLQIAFFGGISNTLFFLARGLYLFFNTYLLTNERFELITKGYATEVNSLLMQSNPYFLYNSLNKLNTIIQEDDFEKALSYNSEISSMLNMQLQYSNVDFITLEEELVFLHHYLSVEKISNKNAFDYSTKIHDEDIYLQNIPPMLLQPLAECFVNRKYTTEPGNEKDHIYIDVTEGSANEIIISIGNDIPLHAAHYKKPMSNINMERRIQLINQIGNFHISITNNISEKRLSYNLCIKELKQKA